MKFGKLPSIDQIDFNLPADAPGNSERLADRRSSDDPPVFFIGCTGWSMKEWVGKVYPLGAKSKDFLSYYGQQFNTIELNTTHYRIPLPDTVHKWTEQVPEDFRFCPKIPQSISHSGDFGYSQQQVRLFSESIRLMGAKLGCCFMQLPPYFGIDRLKKLERFLLDWPQDLPLAMEFRHESWFEAETQVMTMLDLLSATGKVSLLTDVAGRRDVLHMGLTSDQLVVRFVGNDLAPSDFQRIDRWVSRISAWVALGLKKVYFFTHEPDNLLAPEMAHYLHQRVADQTGMVVRGPDFYGSGEGDQMSLF